MQAMHPLVSKVHCEQSFESGRRGSNSRPLAWKAKALSTELLPQLRRHSKSRSALGGKRWIRTTEGKNQQIYSLPHLATLVSSQNFDWYISIAL